jgi:dephospho-CoA kinase
MITFGLTGGIACGKSTATKTFRAHKIPIVDADIVARQVVEPGTTGLAQIVEAFGKEYLQADGTLDRIGLGRLVFFNQEAMNKINIIMAPLINDESQAQIKKHHDEGNYIVGYDAALIVEQGNADKYRPLIVVSCPQDMQVARLMSRNSLTREEAMARIAAQYPLEEKVKLADYVIDSSQTIEFGVAQTEKIIDYLWVKMLQAKLDSGEITYNQVPWRYRDTAGNDACWDCDQRPCVCDK